MKSFKLCLSLIAVAAATVAVSQRPVMAQADPTSPAILISIASINKQFGDIEYVMNSAGMGAFAPMARMSAAPYLRGIDQEKPIAAMLYFWPGEENPRVLVAIPVTNLDDVLDTISEFADVDEQRDGAVIGMPDGTRVTVRQVGNYAYASEHVELIEGAPRDPAQALGDLPSEYNVAAKIYGQRVPKEVRDRLMQMITEGYQDQLEMMGGPAELQTQLAMEQFKSLVDETDEMSVGFAIDRRGNRMYLDMTMVGLDRSRLARQSRAMEDVQASRFAGFLIEGAAATFHANSGILREDAEQINAMLDNLAERAVEQMREEADDLSEQEVQVLNQSINTWVDVLKRTFSEGTFDMGGVVLADNGKLQMAMGMHIVNPEQAEQATRRILDVAKQKGNGKVEVFLNDASRDGINYHRVVVDISDEDEEMRNLFGDNLTVIVGFGDNAVYVAAGQAPMETLQRARGAGTRQTRDMPMSQFNVYLAPIMELVGRTQGEPMFQDMARALRESGNDRIFIHTKTIPNGQTMRMEIQDGLLKLIGMAAQNFGGGFGGPDF